MTPMVRKLAQLNRGAGGWLFDGGARWPNKARSPGDVLEALKSPSVRLAAKWVAAFLVGATVMWPLLLAFDEGAARGVALLESMVETLMWGLPACFFVYGVSSALALERQAALGAHGDATPD